MIVGDAAFAKRVEGMQIAYTVNLRREASQ
jgi:hypothetical protein